MRIQHYIACDLGADSGRVMLGSLADGKLTLEEIHRFPTGASVVAGTLRWDVVRIYDELKAGLRKVAARGVTIASLSADAWGVDYVLMRDKEPLLTLPYQYRDSRTDNGYDPIYKRISADEIFAETGIQFLSINTLPQLMADLEQRREILQFADRFLCIGDYFNHLFSGANVIEESMASTTQLYNPRTRQWSQLIIQKLGLPPRIFPSLCPSGTKLGPLLPSIATETGLTGVQVVATCSHDTGAAVAAVPAEGADWAYLSSGTWSLLGIESGAPIITAKSRQYNFTNEVGFGGSIRFLKNIIGLWIVQECRRTWARAGQEFDYRQLEEMAFAAEPFQAMIHPEDPRFGKPDTMPDKIAAYCRETGQTPPASPGATIRCVLESLALLYRERVQQLTEITGHKINRLHVVGGGSKDVVLNQLTANALQIPVHAGPAEATSIGNILIQAIALGHLKSLAELRQVVHHSFPVTSYQPDDATLWQQATARFQKLPKTS